MRAASFGSFAQLVSGLALIAALAACGGKKDKAPETTLTPQEMSAAPVDGQLAPAEGMNFTPLFAEKIKDPKKRFKRLETTVQSLRDDLDVFAPTIEQRLEVVENALRGVSEQQQAAERLRAEEAARLAATPVGDALGLRIGDHMDKTRLVIDLTAVTDAKSTLQNNGRELVIDLPRLNWLGKTGQQKGAGALVTGYRFEGGRLYVSLSGASVIKGQQVIAGGAGKTKQRLVIDLHAKGLHQ